MSHALTMEHEPSACSRRAPSGSTPEHSSLLCFFCTKSARKHAPKQVYIGDNSYDKIGVYDESRWLVYYPLGCGGFDLSVVALCLTASRLLAHHCCDNLQSAVPLSMFIGSTFLAITFMGGVYAVLPAYEADLFGELCNTRSCAHLHSQRKCLLEDWNGVRKGERH